jgi:hypothetical protein
MGLEMVGFARANMNDVWIDRLSTATISARRCGALTGDVSGRSFTTISSA